MKIIPISSSFIEAILSDIDIFERDDDKIQAVFSGVNALFNVLLGSFPGIVWICDEANNIIFPETEGIKRFHLAEDFDKAQSFLEFISGQFAQNKDLETSIENRLPISWSSSFEDIVFDNYLYPIPREGSVCGEFIGISIDVSHKLTLKKKLEKAKKKRDRADKVKDAILSRMSHEIFAPLNEINVLAKAACEERDFTAVNQYLRKINSASRRLTQIVNDMLGIKKIKTNSVVLTQNKFNVWKKLEGFIQLTKEQLNLSGLNTEIYYDEGLPIELVGDDVHFYQIIVNLVLCSAKLHTKEGAIKLFINRGRNVYERQEILLRVINTGDCINRQDLDRMLIALERDNDLADNDLGSSDYELSVIRNMVEAMEGSVIFKSDKSAAMEIAANIWLSMPDELEPEDEAAKTDELSGNEPERSALPKNSSIGENPDSQPEPEHDASALSRNYSKYTVLAVDDIEINLDVLSIMLESTGINIRTAGNGSVAVEMFRNNPGMFDLILMDIQMPIMDGYEATRKIRKLEGPTGGRIPILAMSVNFGLAAIEAAFDSGMDGYVTKPFELKKLVSEMGRYLE